MRHARLRYLPEALLLPKDLEEEVGTLAVVVKIRS